MLIDDTLDLWKESIHKTNLDADIPALTFPGKSDRVQYANTLCAELNGFSRKKHIRISARGMVSKKLNLVLMTVIFGDTKRAYTETDDGPEVWNSLEKVNKAAKRENGSLHYLRGFSYFEEDRIHILKPATMRNWSRTAALNDADAIFEHQITHRE